MWRNWNVCTLLVGMQNDTTAIKTIWRFLRKKLKLLLLCDPANLLLGIYLEESKARYQRDIFIPMFTAALFTIAKMWK